MAEFNHKEIAADPEEHCFHIPIGAFWDDVPKSSTDIGSHLDREMILGIMVEISLSFRLVTSQDLIGHTTLTSIPYSLP